MKLLPLHFAALLSATSALSAQQSPPGPAQDTPHGKVVFERSTSDPTKPVAASGGDPSLKSTIADADRAALTFTRYALDVRLQPGQNLLEVRAQVSVRNDSDHPLAQIPLQLSSTLKWDNIRVPGGSGLLPCRFRETLLDSDTDHTGQLNEAAVLLPQPLAPGASLDLDVIYSGQVRLSAQRLESIGTPHDVALHSDWDEIAPGFIGLRGFGNVAWYPVSSVPARLGDGDKVFAEIGRVKQRQAGAVVSIRVSDDLSGESAGAAPSVAILNGTAVPVTGADVIQAELPAASLGFQTLSLILAARSKTTNGNTAVYARPDDSAAAQTYLAAATTVSPLIKNWLGDKPRLGLAILDLPATDDSPFEERQTLFTGLQPVMVDKLTAPLSHALSHAYFMSPRPWLNEGVAFFLSSLWTEHTSSRDAALAQLNEQRAALALAEPGEGAGPTHASLLNSADPIFYRTKAAYVLWMLRSMIGDAALQSTLKAYDPAADTSDDYFEKLVGRFAQAEAKSLTDKPDLQRFFDDWVYHDRGLPDLSITGVYSSKGSTANSYLVAVNIANSGGASADVPVTLTSGTTQVTERMLVPAHGTAVRRILIEDAPVQVQVNDGTVPEVEASEHVQRIHYTQPVTP